jgi:PAS domain S-box-containing protein
MDMSGPKNKRRSISLAAFPELNPNPIIEVDSSGAITYINAAAKRLFPDFEETGAASYLVDIEMIASGLRQKEDKLHVREIRIGRLWYQQSIFVIPGVDIISIFGVDVTKLKQAEELLLDDRNRLNAILESSMDAVILIDGEGVISYFNPGAENMFGYTKDEVIGRRLHDLLVSEKARSEYLLALPEFSKTGLCRVVGKTLELGARRKDETRFPVEIAIASMQIGGKWHSVGTIRDISSRKKPE